MSLTGQPSSSRRGEKAPMEPLTPLQEKEQEIADLLRQFQDFQQRMDESLAESLAENENLKAEQEAKNENIDRLTEDKRRLIEDNKYLTMALFTRDSELESYKERIIQLRGTLEDLFGPVSLAASEEAESKGRASPQPEQSGSDGHAEELESQKTLVGLVPVAASTKPESKMRASLQLEQSGSDNHAQEPESQKMLEDTSEEGFKTVEVKKKKLADGSGSKATITPRSLSSTNYFRVIDPDDHIKKKGAPKKVQAMDPKPADTRYVVPSPAKVKSDKHSPVGLTILSPRPTSPSAPEPVKDYAQMAAKPAAPAFVVEGWNADSPGLSETRKRWIKDLEALKLSREREQNLAKLRGSSAHLTLAVNGSRMSRSIPPHSSDEEVEQKPDASVETGFTAATSQTRGKYWPRGVL